MFEKESKQVPMIDQIEESKIFGGKITKTELDLSDEDIFKTPKQT